MPHQCFMLELSDLARRRLRRLTLGGGTFHQAEVVLDDVTFQQAFRECGGAWGGSRDEPMAFIRPDGTRMFHVGDYWDRGDPRWPKTSSDGYEFQESDEWQVWHDPLYRAPDGKLYTREDAPPGAMMFTAWYEGQMLANEYHAKNKHRQPVEVKLANGRWFCVDSRASGTSPDAPVNGWDTTGEPPFLTCTPSIAMTSSNHQYGWHGWLQNGVLTDDCEGRTYPPQPWP